MIVGRPAFARQALALVRSGRPAPEVWLLAFFVLSVTSFAELTTMPEPGGGIGPAFVAAGVARTLGVVWITSVLIRAAADRPPLLRPTMALVRMAAAYLLLAVLVPGAVIALAARLPWVAGDLADLWLALFLASLAAQLLVLRFLPWLADLALADGLGFRRAWLGLAGAMLPLVRATVLLVAPFMAVHIAITLMIDRGWAPAGGVGLVALLGIDTLVSTLQLGFGCVLAVLAWAVARERTTGLDARS